MSRSRIRTLERRFPSPCGECSDTGPVEVVTTYHAELHQEAGQASGPHVCAGCGGPPPVARIVFSMPGPPPAGGAS